MNPALILDFKYRECAISEKVILRCVISIHLLPGLVLPFEMLRTAVPGLASRIEKRCAESENWIAGRNLPVPGPKDGKSRKLRLTLLPFRKESGDWNHR
jgi:hypothetical protein